MPHQPGSICRRRTVRSFLSRAWFVFLLVTTLASCTLSLAPTSSGLSTTTPRTPEQEPARRTLLKPPAPGESFVFLFEWPWLAVAQECERFLGPQGYGAVLVSPPNEHALIHSRYAEFPWWQRYQPVSFRLDRSRSGTRDEFIKMVARCRAAGVAIYVDAVLNHMAADNRNGEIAYPIGSAGTVYDGVARSYPPLFGAADFHQTGKSPCSAADGGIKPDDYQLSADPGMNQQRAQNLWFCALDGLPDLDQRSAHVQHTLVAYLSELVRLGVAGFRIDSARHIPPDDLDRLFDRVNREVAPAQPFYFLEISDLTPTPVPGRDYLAINGDVGELPVAITEFRVGAKIGRALRNKDGATLASLRLLLQPGADATAIPRARQIIFVDNHDTQRNKQGPDFLSYRDDEGSGREPGRRLYTLANIALLALPGGYPQIMSSYAFEMHPAIDPYGNGGPPADWAGNTANPYYETGTEQLRATPRCFGTQAGRDWVCEHRWPEIVAMVGFRRALAGADEVDSWWDNGANQIAFGLGRRGFVAINREAQSLTHTWATGLPDGVYCDVLDQPFDAARGVCRGRQLLVRDGLLFVSAKGETSPVTLEPYQALAVHIGAKVQ